METMKIDEKRSARPTRLNNLEIALAVLSTVSDSGRMVHSHEVEQAAKTASAGHPEFVFRPDPNPRNARKRPWAWLASRVPDAP